MDEELLALYLPSFYWCRKHQKLVSKISANLVVYIRPFAARLVGRYPTEYQLRVMMLHDTFLRKTIYYRESDERRRASVILYEYDSLTELYRKHKWFYLAQGTEEGQHSPPYLYQGDRQRQA